MIKKLLLLTTLIPIIISLFATNTRGPLFFTIIIILLYIYIFMDISFRKKFIFTSAFIIIALIIFLILPESMSSRYLALFQKGTLNTNVSRWSASSSAMRVIFARRLLTNIINNPLSVFVGNGAGGFAPLFKDYGIWVYPHNIILEIIYEQGLLGISIFSLMLIRLGIDLYKIRPLSENTVILFLCFVFFMLNAQVSGDLESNRFVWLFLGALVGHDVIPNNKVKIARK